MIKAATQASEPSAPAGQAGAADKTATQSGGVIPPAQATAAATGQAEKLPPQVKGAEIPPVRIEAAVRNARAQTMGYFGIPKDAKPADIRQAIEIHQALRTDPQSVFDWLLKSGHVKLPNGNGNGQQDTRPQDTTGLPQADLRSEDGKEAYSAPLMLKVLDAFEQRLMAKFEERLNPVQRFVETEQTTREQTARRDQNKAISTKALAQARELPNFKDNEPAILERLDEMAEANPNLKHEIGPVAMMMLAYGQVLKDRVFPTIATTAEQRVREENERKAATSRGQVSPVGSTAGAKVPELNGPEALAKHMERLEASMSA